MKRTLIGIAENIRSLTNVGSLFRTADALGIDHLYLTGTTGHPHPDQSWRRDHRDLQKTALGAEEVVPWTYSMDTLSLIQKLRSDGFCIVTLEVSHDAQPLSAWKIPTQPIALIVGNEVDGIPKETLAASDVTLAIPMQGAKESLNVSVSFGIAAYWLLNK